MNTIDDSTALGLGMLTFVLIVVLYVWTALALSAVFRKSGEQPWKAWVPIYNQVVLLQLGGYSGWLYLLILLPFLGPLLVWALLIAACYRINVAFGHGVGMTVLAALLLPVWATILGFGPARWLGTELTGRGGPGGGPRRTTAPGVDDTAAYVPRATPPAYTPSLPVPLRPVDTSGTAAAAGIRLDSAAGAPGRGRAIGIPSRASVNGAGVVRCPAPARRGALGVRAAARRARRPVGRIRPRGRERGHERSHRRGFRRPRADLGGARAAGSTGGPRRPTSGHGRSRAVLGARAADHRAAGDPGAADVRARASGQEPWAPARSPLAGAEAFPDTSGQVSAVVGAPDAGTPRSARASVSAQHTKAEIPDDPIDETIITRRRRTAWSLVPPAGAAIPLTAEIVLVGRKPAPDRAYPEAQLVSIDDGTVSKTHARLALRDDHWYVTDLGSTNGVLFATLMGTEVEATPGEEIEAGERFFLGDAEVRLQRSDG